MSEGSRPNAQPDSGLTWVTIREAAEHAGVSTSLVRGWYRKGKVRSHLEAERDGARRLRRRMVALEDVLEATAQSPPDGSGRALRVADTEGSVDGSGEALPAIVEPAPRQGMLAHPDDVRAAREEAATALDRAEAAEAERDALLEQLRLMQDRIERLEAQRGASDALPPSAPEENDRDPGSADVEDVTVEWRSEEPPAGKGHGPLWDRLRRR